MSRFAGEGNRQALDLDEVELTGGPRTNSASAADNVNLGSNYRALAERAPKYDQFGADVIADRSAERNAYTNAEASLYGAGITAKYNVKAAEIAAEAAKEAAQKNAAASKKSSIIGGIGTVLSAGIGLLSDEKTKQGVENIDRALDKLRKLRPVSFYYKPEYVPDPERKHYGFIAQEFKEVLPDAVYTNHILDKLCVDTNELIALLVQANQELEARVTHLEAKSVLQEVKQ